jgi:serine/threonine-protein kinase
MGGEPKIGRVLDGRYELTRLIGRGGMGAVYEAVHRGLGKRFAVKMLLASAAGNEEAYARFLREARAASSLAHPHIVEVTDFGHSEEGEPYLVMEYLEGEDLQQTLVREGRLGLERAAPIFQKIFSAMQVAHQGGIVHRDLKPQNLFLCRYANLRDFPKVLDFGISKILDAATTLTTPDSHLGTPEFMAPEQAEGLSLAADPRTDVFALGAILYRTLSGEAPFGGSTPVAVFYNVVHRDPRPLAELCPALPAGVAAVVARALAKAPADRFESVAALSAAFCGAVGLADEAAITAAPTATPVEVGELATRLDSRNELGFESTLGSASGEKRSAPGRAHARAWLVVAGLVAMAAAGVLALSTSSRDAEPDRPAVPRAASRALDARPPAAERPVADDLTPARRVDLVRPATAKPAVRKTKPVRPRTRDGRAAPPPAPAPKPGEEKDVDY